MTETEEQTEFKFSELSKQAKDAARDANRDWNVNDGWWDYTYEDAVRMAKILGIEIGHTVGGPRRPPRVDISFSGFSSQGDGASFTGRYNFAPDAVAKMKAETNDETLIRFAEELAVLQVTAKLKYGHLVYARIESGNSHYSHSGTMRCEVFVDDPIDVVILDDESPWLDIFRSFADWIYANLEAEYEHLTSDEVIDEHLADLTFDEDGVVI